MTDLEMFPHHQRGLDGFLGRVNETAAFDAVILTGSVATGRARPDSDLDCYLVVADEEYATRARDHDLGYIEFLDEGGYVDGKLITMEILRAAAQRGSEPTRASFVGARVLHSSLGDLQPNVDEIGRYPEENRSANIADFYSHFVLHAGYFGPAAVKKDDPFLLNHAITNMTFFAGRLLLSYNRELFPCPKQLMQALAGCRELPDDFIHSTVELLRSPDLDRMSRYLNAVASFTDWGISNEHALSRFMEIDEWAWLNGSHGVAHR